MKTKFLLALAIFFYLATVSCVGTTHVAQSKPIFIEFEGRPFSIVAQDIKKDGNISVILAVKYTGLHAFDSNNGRLDLSKSYKLKCLKGAMLANPLDLDTADINNDGFLDLAYATEGGVQILINSGDGIHFDCSNTLPSPKMSFNLRVIDLNKDNIPDIVTGGTLDDTIYIYLSRSTLGYELKKLKVKSTNEFTPFSMQRPFSVIDLNSRGYPSLLIPEFQNSVLWLIENIDGRDFVPYPIYISDFNNKIHYALPLQSDGLKAKIAVTVGSYNPAIEIFSLDIQTKQGSITQRIPLPEFRDPVHITQIDNSRLLVTSVEGLTILNKKGDNYFIQKTYPLRQLLTDSATAVMSIYYPKERYIFTALQKRDGILVIPLLEIAEGE